MCKQVELYDATEHLKLLYQDAGLEYPEGETFIVPVSKWRKWLKALHLVEHAEETEDARQDNTAA